MDLRGRIREVLERGHLLSLGTTDDGGVWVSDVIYIFDEDLNIYWMSDPEVRHSQAILKNNQVAGTITVSNQAKEKNFGLQIEGEARKIDEPRFDLATKHMLKRGNPAPSEKDDVLQGDSWFVVHPNKIELIDEENLGFNKETLKLN